MDTPVDAATAAGPPRSATTTKAASRMRSECIDPASVAHDEVVDRHGHRDAGAGAARARGRDARDLVEVGAGGDRLDELVLRRKADRHRDGPDVEPHAVVVEP